LAISDIIYLTLLFLEAFALRIPVTWLDGEIGCAFFEFCYRMSVGLTAYSVAVLSIQRYRVKVLPLHVRVSLQPTWRGTGAIICGMWVVVVLFTIPAVRSKYRCGANLYFWLSNYYQYLAIFHLFVIPLCVIAFSYIMTVRHLVKSSSSLYEEAQNPQLNTRRNTAKVVLGLTPLLVIIYVLYHISETYICSSFKLENLVVKLMGGIDSFVNMFETTVILRYFLSINPCLNPVALFCTSLAFRRHLKRYLTCCCKPKSFPTRFERTRRN
jgi:hypothetical protein